MDLGITNVLETCLYVEDTQRAVDFYHGTLGIPLHAHKPGEFAFLRLGPHSMLLLFVAAVSRQKHSPPPHHGAGDQHFCLQVPDEHYEAAKAKLQAIGIPIEEEILWPTGKRSFYFRDPEHNALEIAEPGIWG